MKKSREQLTLIFADGTKFRWRTWKLGDARKAMKKQKKHGHPVDIIGDGLVAQTLRERYVEYKKNPSEYRSDIFGTASKLSGKVREDLEEKFGRIKKKLRL